MTDVASAAMFGVIDIIVLGGVASVILYFFVFRKKKEEVPAFKKLTVGYVLAEIICSSDPYITLYAEL